MDFIRALKVVKTLKKYCSEKLNERNKKKAEKHKF